MCQEEHEARLAALRSRLDQAEAAAAVNLTDFKIERSKREQAEKERDNEYRALSQSSDEISRLRGELSQAEGRVKAIQGLLDSAGKAIEGLSPWPVKAAELANERDRAVGVLRKLQIVGEKGEYLCESPLDFLKRLDATCDALTEAQAERDRLRDYVAGLGCERPHWTCESCGEVFEEDPGASHDVGMKQHRGYPVPEECGPISRVNCQTCEPCKQRAAKVQA